MLPARKDVRDRHERRKSDDDSYRICTVFQSQHLEKRVKQEEKKGKDREKKETKCKLDLNQRIKEISFRL